MTRDFVVVSPDVGRVAMATHYAEECLGASVVVLHKRRVSGSQTKVTDVVGKVSGRACLVVDDMIATGGTVAESIKALLATGARSEIVVAATHGLFVPGARNKLSHPAVRDVFVTDTVRVTEKDWPQLRVISIAPLIADAVQRLQANGSLGELQKNAEPASRPEADGLERLWRNAANGIVNLRPHLFAGFGRCCRDRDDQDFTQTTDEEVRDLLARRDASDKSAAAPSPTDAALIEALRAAAYPLAGGPRDYDPFMERIGEARFALLGLQPLAEDRLILKQSEILGVIEDKAHRTAKAA